VVSQCGNGSHENAGPFTVVTMEKEAQTSFMQKPSGGERKRLANNTSQPLSQCVMPALHMCHCSWFLSDRYMLLFWNHCLIHTPKIRSLPLKLLRSSPAFKLASLRSSEYACEGGCSLLCLLPALQRYCCFPFGAWPLRVRSSLPQCGP
jgi:hypothetical protein